MSPEACLARRESIGAPLTTKKKSGIFLVFLSSSKILPLVIAHGILTRRHLAGKVYTKF
jgi:hypothetical protein